MEMDLYTKCVMLIKEYQRNSNTTTYNGWQFSILTL